MSEKLFKDVQELLREIKTGLPRDQFERTVESGKVTLTSKGLREKVGLTFGRSFNSLAVKYQRSANDHSELCVGIKGDELSLERYFENGRMSGTIGGRLAYNARGTLKDLEVIQYGLRHSRPKLFTLGTDLKAGKENTIQLDGNLWDDVSDPTVVVSRHPYSDRSDLRMVVERLDHGHTEGHLVDEILSDIPAENLTAEDIRRVIGWHIQGIVGFNLLPKQK